MKFGVVQFPGSNCDDDACHAIASVIEQPVEFIWHQSEDLAGSTRSFCPADLLTAITCGPARLRGFLR